MKEERRTGKVDVCIVGGGPAGSNAARLLKEYDDSLDVILFERGKEPAANCAGGLGLPFYNHMGIKPPEDVVMSPIREVVLAGPTQETSVHINDIDLQSVDWVPEGQTEVGWVVDRQKWDNWQLGQAEKVGVDVRRKHVVSSISQNNNVILGVNDRDKNESFTVEAEYVALANGPNWQLAMQAGFNEEDVQPGGEHMHMGLQYHMKDPDYFDNYGWDAIYLKFDRQYAPKGYTWSFPEGKEYTRWGNAVPLSEPKNASDTLNRFFKDHNKEEYIETARQKTNAIIPTARPLDTAVNGKVALVGDTGHHCDPLHGGGMMFGARAGKAFAEAISRQDISLYDELWQDDFLDTIQHRFIIRNLIYSMDNNEYDRLISSIDGFNVQSINPDIEIPRLMWHCFKKDSSIFTKSAAKATKTLIRQKIGI